MKESPRTSESAAGLKQPLRTRVAVAPARLRLERGEFVDHLLAALAANPTGLLAAVPCRGLSARPAFPRRWRGPVPGRGHTRLMASRAPVHGVPLLQRLDGVGPGVHSVVPPRAVPQQGRVAGGCNAPGYPTLGARRLVLHQHERGETEARTVTPSGRETPISGEEDDREKYRIEFTPGLSDEMRA